jgi:hypothetical protein
MDNAPYAFNDDLLFSQADRAMARRLYPNVSFALENDELKALFEPADSRANAAKRKSRTWGFVAVALVTGSLLVTSAEPLYPNLAIAPLVVGLSSLAGVLGAVIGAFGVLFARSKRLWLEDRFVTERLRQFHFQSVVFLASDILEAAASGDHGAFLKSRSRRLLEFQQAILGRVRSAFDAALDGSPDSNQWLFPSAPAAHVLEGPHADELLAAYDHLRFRRQIDFADYKLRRDRSLLSSLPIEQAARFAIAALVCVVCLFLLHIAVAVGVWVGLDRQLIEYSHVLAIWFAILALALRTLEQGLQPSLEVERYRHYRSAARNLRHQFESAKSGRQKLQTMRHMEQLTYVEMVNFLTMNQETQFVM